MENDIIIFSTSERQWFSESIFALVLNSRKSAQCKIKNIP